MISGNGTTLDNQAADIIIEQPRRSAHLAKMVALGIGIALFLLGPPIFFYFNPENYTPAVDTLFAVFLTLMTFTFGRELELSKARQQANDRWLPQAEAVIYRLITLYENVRKFVHKTRTTCSRSQCDLPELAGEDMRAVRVRMQVECEASADRLTDIGNQLEDAIGDWQRFIAANCYGDECYRIYQALGERREKMNRQILEETELNRSSEAVVREDPSTPGQD